ncbi:MAG: Stp1/IreP family PP2C-type Ser/Thr phosphatase [bacterium]|nr:Stp1/IreP family PP2C-type Ser/Thr phosphatase [bacterium]
MKSAFGLTDVGKERSDNEDYFRIVPEKCLFIVADGMGGHNAGDIASLNASQMVDTYFSAQLLTKIQDNNEKIEESIVKSLLNAHREILRMAKGSRNYEGMGCTMALAFIRDNDLHVGHVGDARAYICNDAGIKLLTEDHSYVMELVKKGKMTMEEARLSPLKNRLNQAIGASVDIIPDYGLYSLQEGDRILLCSDGLWDMLTDEQLHQTMMQDLPPKTICENLIDMANKAGGHDNITAVVIIYKNEPVIKEPESDKFMDTSGEYSFVFKE